MGQPKRQRRKHERPKRPWDKERLERERKLLQSYGLRRKREIWRAEGILRNFRRRARELQASRNDKKEKELLDKLNKLGVRCASIDDVLGIGVEGILARRLQSIVGKKMAQGMRHARQLIVHGHVTVEQRRVTRPGFIVPASLEPAIVVSAKAAAQAAAS